MLKKTVKYTLLSFAVWGLSACSSGRTITINQEAVPVNRPVIVAPTKSPEIKEEILLGNNSKKPPINSTLGERVDIPENSSVVVDEIIEEEPIVQTRPASNRVVQRIAFPVAEYNRVKKRGSSTVSGRIYLQNSHTAFKVNGKKIKLWLNPVTSYSRQWYQKSYLGGYRLSKTDKRLYNYLKFTYSDNNGKFNFYGVPTGDYYLTGTISCADECGYNKKKSLRLVREISVGGGVTTVDLMKRVP